MRGITTFALSLLTQLAEAYGQKVNNRSVMNGIALAKDGGGRREPHRDRKKSPKSEDEIPPPT